YTEEGRSETLYFNNFFTIHIPIYDKDNPQGLRVHKHIFVGNSRLVTAMTHTDNHGDNDEQKAKRYYYHSDHLGSAQFVTDWRGRQYEHIEYTPYGELWIEEVAAGIDKLPFRFTGKELDEDTGLYYYGARYLDPKYSRWLSGDPALNDYMAGSSVGEGGIYNTVNFNVYHYGGNNPIKYVDPTGNDHIAGNQYTGGTLDWYFKMQNLNQSNNKHSADQNLLENRVIMGTNNIPDYGPYFIMSLFGIAQTRTGKNMTAEQVTTGIGYLIENDIVGMEKNKEYLVKNAIAIINYALNILGSDEQALKAKNANEAQASTVKTEKNTYGYGHFGEGDSEGKLVWDPLGEITIINIDRIDYFKFQTKEIKE
ncbi:RHS repeat domain-containing protein, partial [Treponema pedis]|uniref:RHS repeat domain-containing protein n=1 Tax=Treponema pedis TaxID=409322 RepID=UPI001CEF6804